MGFDTFPAQWEWVALIIGAVAFTMAFPPFLQMLFGRPRIVLFTSDKVIDGGQILQCAIVNLPIRNRLLDFLRITRNSAQGLIALFDIRESRTQNKVYDALPYLYSQAGREAQRVDLPAGHVLARFPVVSIDETNGFVYAGLVLPSKRTKTKPLADGVYIVNVRVELGGKTVASMEKKLTVQTQNPYAYWVSS